MHLLKIFVSFSVVWWFLICSALLCSASEKSSKCRDDRKTQIHQKIQSTRRTCDPSSSSNTAGVTQRCSSGFYRDTDGPHRGQCVPCSCNGLSDECDKRTGNCVSCQSNTSGDHCDRCKEGYYGSAANRTCRACPCPFTWNNFASACLDIGSGVVECLCKRGYSGARCERCSFGYYGNPAEPGGRCRPCNCKDGALNVCDSLTGECISSGDSGCGDHCHECDDCMVTVLLDLDNMDDILTQQNQQNISDSPGLLSRLKHLQVNVSETKTLVKTFVAAVKRLEPEVEHLETGEDADEEDLSQLIEETRGGESDVKRLMKNVRGTKLKGEDLLLEAEALLTATQDLINQQLTEVKPGDGVVMMKEAQLKVQEVRERSCRAQRERADREQENAHTLTDVIMSDIALRVDELNQAADSSLREITELLSEAEGAVSRMGSLNMKSIAALQRLEHLRSQLQREKNTVQPVTDVSKDLLKNITGLFFTLEEIKKEFETHAAQTDGAKLELLQKLNNIHTLGKVEAVMKAEQHAEELCREAAEIQQALLDASSFLKKAEEAANQSRASADEASKDVKEGGIVDRAAELKADSEDLWKDDKKTQRDYDLLSDSVKTHQDKLKKQKGKGDSLWTGIMTVSDNLENIRRDDTDALINSAKTSVSASNSSVSDVTESLSRVRQEVDRITVNSDDMVTEAERSLMKLKTALPVLRDQISQVESLSRTAPPGGNMTETIQRIRVIIEETRSFVKRIQAPAGQRCRPPSAQRAEYQLLHEHSWLSYTLPQQDLNHRPHFSINIKTKSTKGLILHAAGKGPVPLLALFIANGKIKMSLGYDRIIHHKQKSNDGHWHRVEFSVERSSFHLLVDGIRVTDGRLPHDEGLSLDLMNPVYLGRDPTGRTTKGHSIPVDSVVGCVREFKMNEEVVGEPEGRHKTLPCSDGLTETGMYFGGGHIFKDHFFTLSSEFKFSFELRPRHLTGLLLHAPGQKSSFSVFLKENKVGVRVKDGRHDVSLSVTPPDSLCDGKFHLLTVSRQHGVIKLEVDSSSEQRDFPYTLTSKPSPETLYIGGSSHKHRLPVSSLFIGCLRDVTLNGLPVSFESGSTVVHPVSINGCPAE
ncbi:laminin subunit alpha-3 [Notolabrus celidotus]|uniref:laminin subunit alpha-3 n=1 Tax=Notolabrus celidotus TaxID=1203425 RepID=UPI00148F570D|nr:laminin subunit alpha-3 [Notolabrus celidotus]